MSLLRRLLTTASAALFPATLALSAAHAITIDWVTVGDPGNAPDTTTGSSYGAVAEEYRIMQFEFTNSQYATFLNAIDPEGTNPNLVYTERMGSNARGGISFRSGNTLGAKYSVRSNMGDKPVNYVSWFDAARVSNWLHNGALSYGSTDSSPTAPQNTGAYTLGTGTSGAAVGVNTGALFYIPTEDQWYKAAFYKGSGTNAGYWGYATQSDGRPIPVTSGTTGIGTAGGVGNFANYDIAANWNGQDGNVTTVGTNGEASAYGAFDMSGNLYEWNDRTGAGGERVGLGGGCWFDGRGGGSAFALSSSGMSTFAPSNEDDNYGFRLASPPPPANILFNIASGTQTQGAAGYPLLTAVNAASVTKTGAGTVVLDAANTYSGPTSIQQGILAITGSSAIASSSLVSLASDAGFDVTDLSGGYTVPSGQTIAGSGTVLGSVTFGRDSTLSPGMFSPASGGSMVAAGDQFGALQSVAVPEPSTSAMAFAGLACGGYSLFRRSKRG